MDRFKVFAHVLASEINTVIIRSSGSYVPDAEVGGYIAERLREKPLKFDGVVWELKTSLFTPSSRVLELVVGTGRYSQYRYTSLDAEFRAKFSVCYWFHALALGALVKTSDEKFLASRRSLNAHLSPGALDFPCGHPTDIIEAPSNKVLLRALGNIVERHVGKPLSITKHIPLVHVREEPKQADDLVYLLCVKETSEQIKDIMPNGKFLDFKAVEISELLQNAHLLAPPLPQALLYLGRHEFGEKWFQQFCFEAN